MPTNKSGNAGIYDAYDDRPDFEPWKPTKAAPKDVASLLPLIQFCYQTAAQGKTEHDKQPPGACYLEPRHYINSGVKSTGSDSELEQRHYIGCLSKSLAAGEAELRRAFEADPAAWLADKLTNDNPFVQPGYADPEPSFAGRRWESAPFEGFRVCSQDKGWMNPGIGCTNPAKNKEARSVWGPDSAHGFRCHARVLLRDDCAEHCRAGKEAEVRLTLRVAPVAGRTATPLVAFRSTGFQKDYSTGTYADAGPGVLGRKRSRAWDSVRGGVVQKDSTAGNPDHPRHQPALWAVRRSFTKCTKLGLIVKGRGAPNARARRGAKNRLPPQILSATSPRRPALLVSPLTPSARSRPARSPSRRPSSTCA